MTDDEARYLERIAELEASPDAAKLIQDQALRRRIAVVFAAAERDIQETQLEAFNDNSDDPQSISRQPE